MPLLHEGRPSNLRFNNLLNPPMFDTHDHFLAEYMLMHDAKQVADHFGAVREIDPNAPKIPEEMKKLIGDNTFMIENSFPWALSGTKKVPRNRMMSRPALGNWLYGHLLKICIPYPRPIWSDRPVHAPLNLTVLFRLITQMHKVGYPAHWLSNILYGICEGSVKTAARAPRETTLRPESFKKSYPQRIMSIGPWRAEFTTLLSIWRRHLPFGVIAPEHALVPPEEILECSFTFPRFREQQDRIMHFTLVFVNVGLVDAKQPDFRKALLDDKAGYVSDSAARFRKGGVHVVTTFKFVTDTRTAFFWMRKDVLDEITSGDSWAAGICRTDTWDIVNGTKIPVSQGLKTVGPWIKA